MGTAVVPTVDIAALKEWHPLGDVVEASGVRLHHEGRVRQGVCPLYEEAGGGELLTVYGDRERISAGCPASGVPAARAVPRAVAPPRLEGNSARARPDRARRRSQPGRTGGREGRGRERRRRVAREGEGVHALAPRTGPSVGPTPDPPTDPIPPDSVAKGRTPTRGRGLTLTLELALPFRQAGHGTALAHARTLEH